MKDEIRTLTKKGDEYELVIDNKEAKWYQKKVYSKDEMKDNYRAIKAQLNQLKAQKAQISKMLKNKKDYTEEELKIKAVFDKFIKNQQLDKSRQDFERINKDIELFEKQSKEIEGVLPEVKRL